MRKSYELKLFLSPPFICSVSSAVRNIAD